MTDKELKKLKRTELLELMLYLRQELDLVKHENEELRRRLEEHNESPTENSSRLFSILTEISEKVDVLYKTHGSDVEKNNTLPDEVPKTEK